MNNKYIISAAIVVLSLASCTNEVEEVNGDKRVPLQLTATIESTRAEGADDMEFNPGESIGFFVAGIPEAHNAKATFDGKWVIDRSDILLDDVERPVRAYYPYDEDIKDSDYGFYFYPGTNWLVSDGTTSVCNEKPEANLKFKHLMARVSIVVNNPEKLQINSVSLFGRNIYSKVYYHFADDYYDPYRSSTPIEITNTNDNKAAESQIIDALLIPDRETLNPNTENNVEITLNLANGKTVTTTVLLPDLKMGGYYRLPINLVDGSGSDPDANKTDANGHEYVDLGLPSGLKWATCNVGANALEEYGDYFAWGETSTKEDYSWGTYKWCNGSGTTLTKYNSDSNWGIVDNKTVLDPEDDAAHVIWGGTWRMPTPSEFEELKEHCTWTWDNMNGHNGYNVTGTNGNSIFLPAAGYRSGTSLSVGGSDGYYWSSTQYWQTYVYNLYFSSSHIGPRYNHERYYGQSVRPVTE